MQPHISQALTRRGEKDKIYEILFVHVFLSLSLPEISSKQSLNILKKQGWQFS